MGPKGFNRYSSEAAQQHVAYNLSIFQQEMFHATFNIYWMSLLEGNMIVFVCCMQHTVLSVGYYKTYYIEWTKNSAVNRMSAVQMTS